MSGQLRKKLNEKELGSLYLLSETPLVVDRIIKANSYNEDDLTSLHASMSQHAPDMAMISVALAGNMIAEAMKKMNDANIEPLAAELKYLSINTLEEVGRIWIDACRYGIANDEDINDIVHQSADILCMFASLLMEISEHCTPNSDIIRAVCAALMYQCEAHADSARSILDNIDVNEMANKQKSKTSIDEIPLPAELQNKKYTDNIVMFSLFDDKTLQ